MGATFTFPDLNAPILAWDKRLPPITRWVVITAVIGLVVWLIFFLIDRNKHAKHTKAHKNLHRRVSQLEQQQQQQQLGVQQPPPHSAS
jgi:hypothetical protein